MSCYLASIEKMTNDYPINNIYNLKKNYFIFYVDTKWKPYECNTCSNDESTIFDKVVPIIMTFNFIQIYT